MRTMRRHYTDNYLEYMTYEQFETIIKDLEQIRERSHSIHKLGIDLLEYEEIYHKVITHLFNSVFKPEGKDWIDWYLYERPGFGLGETLTAFDENDNEICHNIFSLWQTVKPHLK